MNKPVLYSTGCPKCNVISKKLMAANIDFEIQTDIEKITTLCESLNISSLPILEVNGKFLNFGDAVKWVGEKNNAD